MIGTIKVFLLLWLSTFLFWAVALYFCYFGTEVKSKYWIRRLLLGTPFFAVFFFLVSTYGVPKYFVYDHVSPKEINGEFFYPAVKNHIIFQGVKYKTYGIMSQDLQNFESGDELFMQFNHQPLQDYPSIDGIKMYTNELVLLGFFIIWLILINRIHNASVASSLFKAARNTNKLKDYTSYMNASQAIRWLQPFKRRKAKLALNQIRLVYLEYINALFDRLIHSPTHISIAVLTKIRDGILNSSVDPSSIYIKSSVTDTTPEPKGKIIEGEADYDRGYFIPTDSELSAAISKSLAKTLNNFLPEEFFEAATSRQAASSWDLTFELFASVTGILGYTDNKKAARVQFEGGKQPIHSDKYVHFKRVVPFCHAKVNEDKQERSRLFCASYLSQLAINDLLLANKTEGQPLKISKEKFAGKLEELSKHKDDLFDILIKESKSAATEVAVVESVKLALEQNQVLVDEAMTELYHFLSDNQDIFVDLVAQEVVAGLIENALGGAGE